MRRHREGQDGPGAPSQVPQPPARTGGGSCGPKKGEVRRKGPQKHGAESSCKPQPCGSQPPAPHCGARTGGGHGSDRLGSGWIGSDRVGSGWIGSAWHGSARLGTARHSPHAARRQLSPSQGCSEPRISFRCLHLFARSSDIWGLAPCTPCPILSARPPLPPAQRSRPASSDRFSLYCSIYLCTTL